jgi:hypothetical protein
MYIHHARTISTHASASNRGLTLHRCQKCLLLLGLTMAAAVAAPRAAVAQLITPINQCGALISKPGLYSVTESLKSTSDTLDCIQINSSGVNLAITGNLTGPGGSQVTAAGVKILPSAKGVHVDLSGVTVQGFGVGILVQGSIVSITGGGTGLSVQGNAAQGVLLSNATTVSITNLGSASNGGAGLELSHSTGVIVQGGITLDSNGTHGLWVNASSGNQFINIQAADNILDGIYVGESSAGQSRTGEATPDASPSARCCFGGSGTTSQDNIFIVGGVIHNGDSGIVIGAGDSLNVVTNMVGQQNPANDAVDENGNCTTNSWSNDAFAKTKPSCIQ